MSEENVRVTLRTGGQEVTTDSATIERLARELSGMVEFGAEIKSVGVKPVKADGRLVDVEMQIVITAKLNGEVLRALSDRAGRDVKIRVYSSEQMLFDQVDRETGEIRDRERV